MKLSEILGFLRLGAGLALLACCSTNWAGIPIVHWTQDHGVQVYLVESHSIPMVDVQVDFDAGSRRDPANQAGLAGAGAGMLSKGVGSKDGGVVLDENQLSDAWADLGASLVASVGGDRLSMSLRSLTYPDLLPQALQLASRQLAAASFPPQVWQRERERLKAALQEAQTRPAVVAQRAFSQAVYRTHPYGFEMTAASLERIEVEDLRSWHARSLRPCQAKVSIVGAVNREQAQALVKVLLAGLC